MVKNAKKFFTKWNVCVQLFQQMRRTIQRFRTKKSGKNRGPRQNLWALDDDDSDDDVAVDDKDDNDDDDDDDDDEDDNDEDDDDYDDDENDDDDDNIKIRHHTKFQLKALRSYPIVKVSYRSGCWVGG